MKKQSGQFSAGSQALFDSELCIVFNLKLLFFLKIKNDVNYFVLTFVRENTRKTHKSFRMSVKMTSTCQTYFGITNAKNNRCWYVSIDLANVNIVVVLMVCTLHILDASSEL